MKAEAKVRKALRGKFKILQLETGPSGTVYGVVTSPSFVGQEDRTRQNSLWEVLRSAMTAEELRPVVLLVTLSPQEAASIAADAA